VLGVSAVHRRIAGEMLEAALTALTRTESVSDAWHVLLDPDDVIGLKFNRSGQALLGTSEVIAGVVIESIVAAGWPATQVVCMEAPEGISARHGTSLPRLGYDAQTADFGSGRDQLAAVLKQVSALIDIPYLKTHNVATLTCALKNLSHGLIKHPARYHRSGCSPFIADIVALDQIRGKLRLCLVDALRVVYAGGPSPTVNTISDEGVLLASLDPVAIDSIGLCMLNDIRQARGLDPIAPSAEDVGYLAAAHRLGLGVALAHGIEVIQATP
jgi:hypothetical protein